MPEVKKRIAKYDPIAQKKLIESKRETHKDFKIALLSIDTIEKIKELAKAEGLSIRAFLEKTFK